MKKLRLLVGCVSLFLLGSCATIVSGSRQKIKFDSTPANAVVMIDEVEAGKTPFEIKLERKREYDVEIKLDGYKPYKTKLVKKFNAWYIGNILFGGIIGLIVDPATGAIYRLTPSEIKSQQEKGVTSKTTENGMFISVALEVDENWQKVGQLEKL